ncbi:hypothetical protein GQ600_16717 [Phytophthora cactorum]|nr:hypothetical protein GQ600_16717 [Phytophthora cactorum]
MPPPSPTRDGRKEQFVTWKQQREASKTKSPTAKTEPRQRRRSMEAVPMERQETMAATYTKQYLQRRRSQADTTRNEQQRRPVVRADGADAAVRTLVLPERESDDDEEAKGSLRQINDGTGSRGWKENLVTAELESTDKVVAGKTEEVFVTEVVVGLGNAVLEMERTQVELTELLESHNLSEVDSSTREMEDRLKAHFSVPGDGTNLELDVEEDDIEQQKKHTTELTEAEEHAQVQEEISIADDTQIDVEKDADEADAVAEELQRGEESELVSVRNHDQAAAEKETQNQDVHTAISNEIETLETVVAKEIQELEQLEQRVRVEEELRAIAKEEEIWLQTEQASAEGEAYQQDSSEGIPAPTLPGSALTQIGLLSVAFLVLAALTAYLLIRYRKHGLLSRPPRRKRWRRLADMNESDTEEVVLMPDDSSDEEEDTDQAASKEVHDEVIELTSSVEVTATTIEASDDEEAANEEKTAATHEIVEEHEELVENESDSKTSRTVVVGRVQTSTYTVDHPATSSSDASADEQQCCKCFCVHATSAEEGNTRHIQRTRRRRRQVRM